MRATTYNIYEFLYTQSNRLCLFIYQRDRQTEEQKKLTIFHAIQYLIVILSQINTYSCKSVCVFLGWRKKLKNRKRSKCTSSRLTDTIWPIHIVYLGKLLCFVQILICYFSIFSFCFWHDNKKVFFFFNIENDWIKCYFFFFSTMNHQFTHTIQTQNIHCHINSETKPKTKTENKIKKVKKQFRIKKIHTFSFLRSATIKTDVQRCCDLLRN